jgi:hypothetical protein
MCQQVTIPLLIDNQKQEFVLQFNPFVNTPVEVAKSFCEPNVVKFNLQTRELVNTRCVGPISEFLAVTLSKLNKRQLASLQASVKNLTNSENKNLPSSPPSPQAVAAATAAAKNTSTAASDIIEVRTFKLISLIAVNCFT